MSNNKQSTVHVIIADDSPQMLEGLNVLLAASPNYHILDAVSGGEALINSPQLQEADIVLCDIEMPDMNGIEAARQINDKFPFKSLIAISMYTDRIYLKEMIKVGFKGFIHKPSLTEQLFDVMEKVLNNEFVFPVEWLTPNN